MRFMDLMHVVADDCKVDVEFFVFDDGNFVRLKNLTFKAALELDEEFRYARIDWFNAPRKNKVTVSCTVK